jgi:glutaminase
MGKISGSFQFEVGVPASSASTGAVMVIVPNVLGACYYAPTLNSHTNVGVHGLKFCKQMVATFAFHQHDRTALHKKAGLEDPIMYCGNENHLMTTNLINAAGAGDLMCIKALCELGVDLNRADYDLRGAVHLAAAGGHVPVLRYFAEHGANLELKDRWGNIPVDDARKEGHKKAVAALDRFLGNGSIAGMSSPTGSVQPEEDFY